jgi:hypothetical protein
MINYFDKSDVLENVHFRNVLTVASDSIADDKRQFSGIIFSILFPGKDAVEDSVGNCSTINGDELNGTISVHAEEVLTSHVLFGRKSRCKVENAIRMV